jgi:hypothetical protein
MNADGPPLEGLTRRLAETPAEFLAALGVVRVAAVVNDLLVDLGGEPLAPAQAVNFEWGGQYLSLVLVACWLLHDEWFVRQGRFAPAALRLLSEGLKPLAALVPPGEFVADPDRREELVRYALAQLGVRPAGESAAQAQDRLTTLSSVERQRVMAASRKAEERARAIREAMAKKAAEEAADKWNRE